MANIHITKSFDEGLQIVKDVSILQGISATLRDKGDKTIAEMLDDIVNDFNEMFVGCICTNVYLATNSIEDS